MLTNTNVFTLAQLFGERRVVTNHVPHADAGHIRKCLKAGLFTVEGSQLKLTELGEQVLCGYAFDLARRTPAAACLRCGGWTSFGGMSQHAKATVPVSGRIGCTC